LPQIALIRQADEPSHAIEQPRHASAPAEGLRAREV
jgi:hypothetical protein